MSEQSIRVGIGVMVLRNGKVLLSKRIGSHGEGEYAFPGGHLEYMESFEQCARRETLEESGLTLDTVEFQFLSNVKEYAPKHYVHIGMIATSESGNPEVLEPHKTEGWDWYDIHDLPSPLFKPCITQIDSYKTGVKYFDQ